jgi:ABC-2 type transport system permease protein
VRWWTPFGWSELVAPLTANDLWPLLPAVLTTAALVAVAVVAAGRRDVGDGLLATGDVHPPRTAGLGSAAGLAARLEAWVLVWWCIGALAAGAMLGVIAKMTAGSIPGSLDDALSNFGVAGRFVDQYFGVGFLLVATVVALIPASQIGAAAEEEESGRLVHVLVAPTRRSSWLASRVGLAAAAVVVAGVLAGAGAWAAARSQGVALDAGPMLVAGLNVVPTALVALAFGALVLAVRPRWAGTAVYALVAWSLVVDLIGSLVGGLDWLRHVSLFDAMALAPAEDPDPVTVVVTLAVALVLAALALLVFERRDVGTG